MAASGGAGGPWWWLEIQVELLPCSCIAVDTMIERGNERGFPFFLVIEVQIILVDFWALMGSLNKSKIRFFSNHN